MQMRIFAAIGLSLATALTSIAPAEAFPSFLGPRLPVSADQVSADVVQVKQRKWYRKRASNRGYVGRYFNRGDNDGSPFLRYYRRGDNGGHRYNSYRYNRYNRYKNYYRNYYDDDFDDFGAVFGGLAAGAIIGGLLAQPYYGSGYYAPGYSGYYAPGYYAPRYYGSPRYYGTDAHANWCYARYRSYRAYDNTFQPYYGPRRQCISP